MEFFATCPKGFEPLLSSELASMGTPQTRTLHGQVAFAGELADAYRVCLWSRLASRVVLVLAHVPASTADELYASLSDIVWESHLSPAATFAVDAHGTNTEIRNTQFLALRSKDAIVDRIHAKAGTRPNVDTANPDLRIVVRLHAHTATVGVDLSGEPLFHRGYGRPTPATQAFAPMRCDYAAALLAAGSWFRACRHDTPTLVSLMSGAGVVLAEAAAEALDRAPGLIRARWGFEGWLGHEPGTWQALLDEADARAEAGAAKAVTLVSTDVRPGSASAVRATLRSAGIPCEPTFVDPMATALADALASLPSGTLATCDLSWTRPDQAATEADSLALVSSAASALPETSSLVSLGPSGLVAAAISKQPTAGIDVLTGSDPAVIDTFEGLPTSATSTVTLKDGTTLPVLVPASDQFAARLAKVARLRSKWARREDVSCYRVYDADLPDYAVAIDLYQGCDQTPGRWLIIAEYAAPKEIDPDLAHRRLLDVLAIAPRILGVRPSDVFLRIREKARGGSQYADGGKRPDTRKPAREPRDHHRGSTRLSPGAHLVDEGGLTFEVNLTERLDTGLFLDHRLVRGEVREMAKATRGSKRFLNLFAYTGTATAYAADGGAQHTTTVDMSRPYLDWARRNMVRNGFAGPEHEYVQADVIDWVSQQRRTHNRWDLVFCDPPTFSNSSRMATGSFDVQRDHAELLIGISRLLTADGVCLFSCNLRDFEPDVEKLARFGVQIEDVTQGTIPEDFSRNARIHHCYLVRRIPRDE